MHNYRRLAVWIRSFDLALRVYDVSSAWPAQERYGLTSQVRKAAVSIPSNIAEGSSQSTPRAFARYLRIALGSANETDTQLRLCRGLGFIDDAAAKPLLLEVDELRRMLIALIRNVRRTRAKQSDTRTPTSEV